MKLLNQKVISEFAKVPFGHQRDKGFDAVCIAKYYLGSWTFFAIEAGYEQGDWLLYGFFVDLRHGTVHTEWGYVSFADLAGVCGVERDLYVDGQTVRQLCLSIGVDCTAL